MAYTLTYQSPLKEGSLIRVLAHDHVFYGYLSGRVRRDDKTADYVLDVTIPFALSPRGGQPELEDFEGSFERPRETQS